MANMTFTRRTALTLALQSLVARAALARTGPAPFNLDAYKMPTGDKVADVLPARVGDYEREAVPAGARVPIDEEFYVTYRRGAEHVSVGASIPGTPDDAREAVKTAAQETRDELRRTNRSQDLPRIAQDLRGDPAYLAVGDFVAWSKGRYFLAAKASSPRTLATFMQGITK